MFVRKFSSFSLVEKSVSHIHRRESLESYVRGRRRLPSCLCSSVFCIFRNFRGTARGFNSL
jgi:hypothetical protein